MVWFCYCFNSFFKVFEFVGILFLENRGVKIKGGRGVENRNLILMIKYEMLY